MCKTVLFTFEGVTIWPRRKIIRRDWTTDDVRKLKSLAKQKTGVAKIAKELNRTPGATTAKAHMLGVSLARS